MREQESARRTIVSTASHELRTPLASLQLMLHSANEELDTPEPDLQDTRDQLGRAVSQTERLCKLAVELLDLSRLDAGGPPGARFRLVLQGAGAEMEDESARPPD